MQNLKALIFGLIRSRSLIVGIAILGIGVVAASFLMSDEDSDEPAAEAQADYIAEVEPPEVPQQVEDAIEPNETVYEEPEVQAIPKPSFDCSKATTRSERLVCSSGLLAGLDVELAEAYRAAIRDEIPLPAAELKADQINWIRGNNQCRTEKCLEQRYRDRISYLTEFDAW